MLPVVRDHHRDALYPLLVVLYETSMIFKSRNILPPLESGSINQQSDFAMLADKGIDLRRYFGKVACSQFLGRHDFQRIAGDKFCLDHAKSPSGPSRFMRSASLFAWTEIAICPSQREE